MKRSSTDAHDFRPSIQGLRAVAVLAVVLFHLWPTRLTGGYVGVDVFFVISGFLITAHITREIASSGTLNVPRFWGRRIKRLLPASLVVIAATVVMTLLWIPQTAWNTVGRHVLASTFYVENWMLVHDAVDYQARDQAPTPVQHFWSLSVEEQFYFVWPLLLVVVVWLLRRSARDARLVIAGVLGVVVVTSLAASVWLSYRDRTAAYYVLQGRMWEFALGGLVAVLLTATHLSGRVRAVLAWGGVAAILAAAVLFDASTVFPGFLALLPAAGAAALIAAGESGVPGGPHRILSSRPFRFIGDISYSVYLWHWPLIILWPFIWGSPIGRLDALAILVLTIALAWATKVVIEDPGRRWGWVGKASWRPFAAAAAGMAVIVAGVGAVQFTVDRQQAHELAVLADSMDPQCRGPLALADPVDCSDRIGTPPVLPTAQMVTEELQHPVYPDCQQSFLPTEPLRCEIGSTAANPALTVAIVGDSHAKQWFTTLDAIGKDNNWRVITYAKASCPVTMALRVLPNEDTDAEQRSCAEWRDNVIAAIDADPQVSLVVTAAFSTAYDYKAPQGASMADPRVDGFVDAFERLAGGGRTVIAIADVPLTAGASVPTCIEIHPTDYSACDTARHDAVGDSALVAAVAKADNPKVQLADLTDSFCDATTCYAAVGNMIVYRDSSHLSKDYALALAPVLNEALEAAMSRSHM